jgi:hypothetical protein
MAKNPDRPVPDRLAEALAGAGAGLTRIEQEAIASAMRKIATGQAGSLTKEEKRALQRHEKQKEERLRWQYYASIPQAHWKRMSGRQAKILQEQGRRYGLPFDAALINLPAVVRALHDFLADNARKLAAEDDPTMLAGPASPALERYREERAILARLERQQREQSLRPLDDVREGLRLVAAVIRSAGDTLNREFGAAAAQVVREALDEIEREIERRFGPLPAPEPDEEWRYAREIKREPEPEPRESEQQQDVEHGGDEGNGSGE